VTEFPLSNSSESPGGIVAGPDGNLWFTEYYSGNIGRITPTGTITEFIVAAGKNMSPSGITLGADCNLWFTDPGNGKVGRAAP
jgi:streptogramin lyase